MKVEATSCLSTSSTTDDLETTATSTFIHNFHKSQTPSRILFIKNNTWVDFPDPSFQKLRDGFVGGDPIQQIEIDGRSYVIDFNRMVQIDLLTRVANPIAWIDSHGQCFFPITNQRLNQDIVSKFPGTERLREDAKLYEVVEKLFTNGMKKDAAGNNTKVTKVYKCMYSSEVEKMRLKAFYRTSEMVKAVRGDANVRFGWFGGSSDEVAGAVKHGFGNGRSIGVHLSSPHFPFKSSLLSEEDENGERHMVLCRVIMGNSEKVEAGSLQHHPSHDDYDSAVDEFENPKWYVVHSGQMSTHILPEYIVAFKSMTHVRQTAKILRRRHTAAVSGLCFHKLLVEMGSYLPSAQLRSIQVFYEKYKVGRMNKDAFIRYLRSTAGDKLLASSIRRIRAC